MGMLDFAQGESLAVPGLQEYRIDWGKSSSAPSERWNMWVRRIICPASPCMLHLNVMNLPGLLWFVPLGNARRREDTSIFSRWARFSQIYFSNISFSLKKMFLCRAACGKIRSGGVTSRSRARAVAESHDWVTTLDPNFELPNFSIIWENCTSIATALALLHRRTDP